MISFVLNTTPTAQARTKNGARIVRGEDGEIKAHSTTYKTQKQRSVEQTLDALLAPHAPASPIMGAVVLQFQAVFPPPKSTSKRARAAMLRGQIHHTKKPDLDNIEKQLKDAMTRLRFWGDDRQVVMCIKKKVYGPVGRWEVCLREVQEGEAI